MPCNFDMDGLSMHHQSVRRAIFVDKLPLPFDHQRPEVVVRVTAFMASSSVAHFEIDNLFLGFVDQSVIIASANLEGHTHTWQKPGSTFVGVRRRMPLQSVDELVLLGMSVAQRRHRLWSEPRQIYPKVAKTKQIAQRLLSPARHLRRERLGIGGRFVSCRWLQMR